jgi:hypothetical protein
MNLRIKNYIIIFILLLSFVASLFNIKTFNTKYKDNRLLNKFILPLVTMVSFFVACYFVSMLITSGQDSGKDKYTGIFFLVIVGIILTIFNIYVLGKEKLIEYIKGKKFSLIGVFMALGVSSIVFGFLDNFGMKLGTEALDDTFLQTFLSPFSTDIRFVNHKDNIKENLKIVNTWASGNWRRIINQVLRFEDIIGKDKRLKDLSNSITKFNCSKLNVPNEILKNRDITNEYVDNIKDKYDIIDGSKSMLGNTFSDFIGAILGAGLINLFIYSTGYDGSITGDDEVDNSFMIKHLNSYMPFLEAIFIAIGCLVPVFLNIAVNRKSNKKNNFYSWLIVGIVAIIIIIMMYLSSRGLKRMNTKEKQKSIKKTLISIKERVDLDGNKNELDIELDNKVNDFINSL